MNIIINEIYWYYVIKAVLSVWALCYSACSFLFLLIKHVLYVFFCILSQSRPFSFSSSLPVFCFLSKTIKYQSLFVSLSFLSSAGVVPSLIFVPAAG